MYLSAFEIILHSRLTKINILQKTLKPAKRAFVLLLQKSESKYFITNEKTTDNYYNSFCFPE